jgi:hypothetical protein
MAKLAKNSTMQKNTSEKRMLLFLDLDGVLHPAPLSISVEGHTDEVVAGALDPRECGLLCPLQQALLVSVLRSRPNVDIVISSAWRTWHPDVSLDWLKSLLDTELAARIVGATPDINRFVFPGIPAPGGRLEEIRQFIRTLPDASRYEPNWIAVDDQITNFHGNTGQPQPFYREYRDSKNFVLMQNFAPNISRDEVVVIVDGTHGLTPRSAQMLGAAIDHAERQSPPTDCGIEGIVTSFDLRMLTVELISQLAGESFAAACVPAAVWSKCSSALVGALERWAPDITRVAVLDPVEMKNYRSDKALHSALVQQLGMAPRLPPASTFVDVVNAFARRSGKRRFVLVIKGLEQLASDSDRLHLLERFIAVQEEVRGHANRCQVAVLALLMTPVAPKRLKAGRCEALGFQYRAFFLPDPMEVPYCFDEE